MRLVAVHNYYRQRGGEDVVFDAEVALLAAGGHEVVPFVEHSTQIDSWSRHRRARLGLTVAWNRQAGQAFERLLQRTRPDLVHVHNTFPLISASVLSACRRCQVPVVATIHNFRLICANGLFFREGRPCEDCMNRLIPWPAVAYGCYHGSRVESAGLAFGIGTHRLLHTWTRSVDVFIALTEFARKKLIECGILASTIVVKSNFTDVCPPPEVASREYAIFVGRLSAEKGVPLLLEAWKSLGDIPLRVVGDGPLLEEVKARVSRGRLPITVMGRRGRDDTMALMRGARFLVAPSLWYEGFPMVVVEAFAQALPVIASRLGSLAEIVEHGKTGVHFEAGSVEGLADKVRWLWSRPEEARAMGQRARRKYEDDYTPQRNYRDLIAIYERAISARAEKGGGSSGVSRSAPCAGLQSR